MFNHIILNNENYSKHKKKKKNEKNNNIVAFALQINALVSSIY